jgi:rhomboid protease GluP
VALRQKSGALVCPSCGSLIGVREPVCPFCKTRLPGLGGFGPALQRALEEDLVRGIMSIAVVLYLVSLAIDPAGIGLVEEGLLGAGSPSSHALWLLGMTGHAAWAQGHWWTLLTASWLHGSVVHILFNLYWVRHLGALTRDLFGPAHFLVIYCLSGAAGFLLSNLVSNAPTVGASAATFGLMGAAVAYGRRRGGTFGRALRNEMLKMAILVFVFGLAMSSTNNWAHAGGFLGGLALGGVLPVVRKRGESQWIRLAALGLGVATLLALVGNLVLMGRMLGWP